MDKTNYIQIAKSKDDVRRALNDLKMDFLRRYPDEMLEQDMVIRLRVGEGHVSESLRCIPGRLREAWLAQLANIIDTIRPKIEQEATLDYPLKIWLDIQTAPFIDRDNPAVLVP